MVLYLIISSAVMVHLVLDRWQQRDQHVYTEQQFETAIGRRQCITGVMLCRIGEVPTGYLSTLHSRTRRTQVMLCATGCGRDWRHYMRDAGFDVLYRAESAGGELVLDYMLPYAGHFGCDVHFLYDHDQSVAATQAAER
ncbi:MAG: hypothetical protein ACLVCH_13805 [Roseburia inulinivorans]